MEPTELDKAYFAGILDGEGYLLLNMGRDGNVHARVGVANNAIVLHEWIKERWGGTAILARGRKCTNTIWNDKASIERILSDVFHLLVIKKKDAELLLYFLSGSNGPGKKHSHTIDYRIDTMILLERERAKRNLKGEDYAS